MCGISSTDSCTVQAGCKQRCCYCSRRTRTADVAPCTELWRLALQVGRDMYNSLLQLKHVASAELEQAASAWAADSAGTDLESSAASLGSATVGGGPDPRFKAQIEAFTKLIEASSALLLDCNRRGMIMLTSL